MTTEKRLEQIERNLRELAEAVNTLVSILVETAEPEPRTFGSAPELFRRKREGA